MSFLFANNATSRLALPVAPGDVQLELVAGTGDRFPSPVDYDYEQFALTLVDPVTGAQEICYCYTREGDTLFVNRGVEDSGAKSWPEGTILAMQITAGILNSLRDA